MMCTSHASRRLCLTGVLTINACLAPVGSLSGYQVVTASGVGDSKKGFHPVQGGHRGREGQGRVAG